MVNTNFPPGLNATNRLLNTDRGFSRCSITSLQMTAFPSSYRTRTDYSLPVSRRTAKDSGHYRPKYYPPRWEVLCHEISEAKICRQSNQNPDGNAPNK